MGIALEELAVRFGCELSGDPDVRVDHVAPLQSAGPGALSFLANPRLAPQLAATRAAAVVLEASSAASCPVAALITSNPHALFARIATLLHPPPPLRPGIHPTAIVDARAQVDASCEIAPYAIIGPDAVVGPRCLIGPACLIGPGAVIGADCRLLGRVTLEHGVRLGARVLVHAGAVIGADGFGLARERGRWLKVPQVGSVRIGDDVEIGANTTIDRGAMDDTVIAEGVKLDNQIQVGHNVQIGAHTAIAACTGISGSVRIGARCMIAGGCGLSGHIEIGDDVVLTGMSMVPHSVTKPGVYTSVIPVEPIRRWWRTLTTLKRLAERDRRGRADQPRPEEMNRNRTMNEPIALDINGVMKYLPHRYPFLLVDRVLEFVPGKSLRALKNVSYNEPYFTGHFPHRPLMPGVIIMEALAQSAGLLAFLTADVIPDENTRFYFVGIDKARFRKPVEPGDQLTLIVNLDRNFKGIYRFATRAEVGGEEVANAQIMIAPDLQSVPGTPAPADLP